MLKPGHNCWRVEQAERAAGLIDCADYFRAARSAILNAKHSVYLIGWVFNPEAPLVHDEDDGAPDTIGELLNHVAATSPDLDVRVLIWDMALPLSAANNFFPRRAVFWFNEHVKFHLDPCANAGASHHQKILVIDDSVAFCGGGDFSPERWDSQDHADDDPRRRLPSGKPYPPRHEVMMIVSGPAAAALGDLARERWACATGEKIAPGPKSEIGSLWPEGVPVEFTDVPVAIARTEAATADQAAVRENEKLYLDSIEAAKKLIFFENQYFTAPDIMAALAARLQEPDGPEVVVLCTQRSPGFLDGLCMDAARDRMVRKLRQADPHNRLHVYSPHTSDGSVIIIHAKVAVIDDTLLRIGSCNIANRSMGFDTECDVAVVLSDGEDDRAAREAVAAFRNRLVAHYLGVPSERVAEEHEARGSLSAAIEALDDPAGRRLKRLKRRNVGGLEWVIAYYHLGDPIGAHDAWKPWRRRSFRESLAAVFRRRKLITSGR